MSLSPTTLKSMRSRIADLLRDITPTYEEQREHGWIEYDRPAMGPRTRAYRIWWENLGPKAPPAYIKNKTKEYEAILHIETHYGGFDATTIDEVCTEDHDQILEVLSRNLHPSVTGLMFVSLDDEEGYEITEIPEEGRLGFYSVDHAFLIRYLKTRP